MQNKIFIRLSIFDADNENITSLLNVIPTKKVQKGDLISPKGIITYKHNIWSYEIVYKNILHIETVFEEIIKLFEPKKNTLSLLGEKHYIEVSISAYLKNEIPSIHITKSIVNFMKIIHAEIDIDLMQS